MYVCSCFGITEQQVKQHAVDGRCTPRQVASACKAGTDCGSCVKRIQSLLGRGAPRLTPSAVVVAPDESALETGREPGLEPARAVRPRAAEAA